MSLIPPSMTRGYCSGWWLGRGALTRMFRSRRAEARGGPRPHGRRMLRKAGSAGPQRRYSPVAPNCEENRRGRCVFRQVDDWGDDGSSRPVDSSARLLALEAEHAERRDGPAPSRGKSRPHGRHRARCVGTSERRPRSPDHTGDIERVLSGLPRRDRSGPHRQSTAAVTSRRWPERIVQEHNACEPRDG